MNAKFYFLAATAALSLSFASCSSNDEESMTPATPTPISLKNDIDAYTRAGTNVQPTQIVEGSIIGVYSFVHGATAVANTKNLQESYGYINIPYTAGATGTLTAGEKIYYPADGTNVDIYAYAPRKTQGNNITNIANTVLDFSVYADQTADTSYVKSDLLWAQSTDPNGVAASINAQGLAFNHKLSKITVNLTGDGNITTKDLKAAIITITNTIRDAKMNISDGNVSITTSGLGEIIMKPSNNEISASAIIVPQTITKDTKFLTITIGTLDYFFSLPNDITFDSGKAYTFNITVSATQAKFSSVKIVDWLSGTTIADTAKIDQ